MKLIGLIETVLKEQSNHFKPIAVDITMSNGNILLRSFHIYDLDLRLELIKGLTQQEEYAHSREGREPVYCYLKLEEIKGFACPDLGLEYAVGRSLARV
jgi:hypothetical protein